MKGSFRMCIKYRNSQTLLRLHTVQYSENCIVVRAFLRTFYVFGMMIRNMVVSTP